MVTAAADTVDRVVGSRDRRGRLHRKTLRAARTARARQKRAPSHHRRERNTGPRVRMGRRVLDLEKRVLIDPASGDEETLAASELDLLKVFAENPNRPLNRDWLWK
jgi:two-component system phosphate regulon response regulator OmpR